MAYDDEGKGISSDQVNDLIAALEDIADAYKATKAAPPPVIEPKFNVPQAPAPVLPAPVVNMKAPQVTIPPGAPHPYANGARIQTDRDRMGNVLEYRILPL